MKQVFSLVVVALIASISWVAPANAAAHSKAVCKETVVASGKASFTKTPGAYLSSLFAWRRAVRDRYGADFQPWRRAQGKNIDCYQGTKNGKSGWICTRSAQPCSGLIAKIKEKVKDKIDNMKKPDVAITQTLRRGDQGEEVRVLQQLLNDFGYKIEVDGNFGRGTRSAVKDFQRKEGLEADGVVGPSTLAKLIS